MMILYGGTKQGKTTALSHLPNCLIIDTEDGTGFVEALTISANSLVELRDIVKAIIEAKRPYKYIAVDTLSEVEESFAVDLATALYKKTPMGSSWNGKGSDILSLPQGLGYYYLRQAMSQIVDMLLKAIPDDGTLILVAHIKDKLVSSKDGSDIFSTDIALTGKIKQIMSRRADAVGLLYRKGNIIKVSFDSKDEHTGSRLTRMAGQEYDVLVFDDEEEVSKNNWNQVLQ